jgi:predicted lipoprotein
MTIMLLSKVKLVSYASLAAGLLTMLCLLHPSACKIATIRRLNEGDNGKINGVQTFNAAGYVDSIWNANLKPSLSQAVEVSELLKELDTNAEGVKARYGHREGGRPYYVVIKGSGRIMAADTSSHTGTATVAIASNENKQIAIQIGPVLRGTAIRDALPFISADRFANQIHFAEVANELNARVERNVLAPIDRSSLKGRLIVFTGMVGIDGNQPPLVTPVQLTMGEAR